MKHLLTLFTTFMIASTASAQPTGEDFLQCSRAPAHDRAACDAYVQGFTAGMMRLDSFINPKEKRLLCASKAVNTTPAKSFYQYLEENPKQRPDDANLLIFVSVMKDHFCR